MKVAVIGAGACGLPAIKACLDEGHEVVCFEYRDQVGGLWNFTEGEVQDGLATVFQSTVTNLCKESMSYSDFLVPREFPLWLTHPKMLAYYQMYAEHFRLIDHIRFKTEVIRVKQNEGKQKAAGQWEVTSRNLTTDETVTEAFDAVMVCIGFEGHKFIPQYEGQDSFQGHTLHSHDFRVNKTYKNKRVVVIGSGNSGFDIAVDLKDICSQVYLSSRTGTWLFPRLGPNGLPAELEFNRRSINAWESLRPRKAAADARAAINAHFDHAFYGFEPDFDVGAGIATVNDVAPSAIAAGTIILKRGIEKMTSNGLIFKDGSMIDDVDVIIFATGYSMNYPFLDHEAFEMKERNDLSLYKMMFVPEIQPPTLTIMGCFISTLSPASISEMQARFVARALTGKIKLPGVHEMLRRTEKYRSWQRAFFKPGFTQYLMVNAVEYMDSLAEEIGCLPPSFIRLWLTDRPLCWAVYTGLFTPHQYRLVGPGAWSGARQAVLEIMDRLQYPVNPAAVEKRQMNRTQKTGQYVLVASKL